MLEKEIEARVCEYAREKGVIAYKFTRYVIAKNGKPLRKWMPPLKGKNEWRKIGVESGWTVCVCNDISEAVLPVDLDYYVREVEKITNCLG